MKKKIGEHVAPIVQLPYINSKDNVAKQLVVVKQTIMIKRSNTAVIEAGSMDTFPHGECHLGGCSLGPRELFTI